MAFEGKKLGELTQADLLRLVGMPESRMLDFKRDTYGGSDSDKKELLADVSSFANTLGGHIILGVDEQNGSAVEIPGLAENADAEKLRLESIIRTGLQPRLPSIEIVSVPLDNGRSVILIEVPESWVAPHRVAYQGSNRFFAREGSGKYEPDVSQLRTLFNKGHGTSEAIRELHNYRVAQIMAGKSPVKLAQTRNLIIHVIPLAAVNNPRLVSVERIIQRDVWPAFFPAVHESSLSKRINLDGVVVSDVGREACTNYVQIGKNTILESCCEIHINNRPNGVFTHGDWIEKTLIETVHKQLLALALLDATTPCAVMASLCGLKGLSLARDNRPPSSYDPRQFGNDVITLSETIMQHALENVSDVAVELKSACDEIFHSCGYDGSVNFTDGRWVRPSW